MFMEESLSKLKMQLRIQLSIMKFKKYERECSSSETVQLNVEHYDNITIESHSYTQYMMLNSLK